MRFDDTSVYKVKSSTESKGHNNMQRCAITNKGKQHGNNVSFSQRHTKRVWLPNLQTKTLTIDGKKVTMKMSTQAIRTLKKKKVL